MDDQDLEAQRPLTMRGKLKTALINFSQSTSAHGPPKIVSHTHSIAKVFWTFLFITGIAVFIYFTQRLIVSYLKYETTTNIQLRFDSLEFPAVTLCNLNQFRKDKVPAAIQELTDEFLKMDMEEMYGGEDEWKEWLASLNSTTQLIPTHSSRRKKRSLEELDEDRKAVMSRLDHFYEQHDKDELANLSWFNNVGSTSSDKSIIIELTEYLDNQTTHDLYHTGHEIHEMLQDCSFLGVKCGPQDFYMFYDHIYGNCYTYNSGMDGLVAKITSPGSTFGLSLTLFINQDQYIPVLSPQAGVRVMLHPQGQVPVMEEDGFNVSPGLKSAVAVKYTEINRLPGEKYSNCKDGNKKNEENLNEYYPGNYTLKGCLKTCIQKEIIKACACASPLYRSPATTRPCKLIEYDCVERIEEKVLDDNICDEKCPKLCWESQYQYTISTSQWPSNGYQSNLVKSLSRRSPDLHDALVEAEVGLEEQFVKLEIYYDNLNYYKYTDRPLMNIEDLVGAIGGHLGLWIGMSVISFVEVFELMITLLGVCSKALRSRNHTGDIQYPTKAW